jgi:hypothetical protein
MWDYQIGLVRITPFFKAFTPPIFNKVSVMNWYSGEELC